MAINYPASLPVPQASTVTPLERRQLSDDNAPRDARALSRDKTKLERLTWPPLSPAQALVFYEWWRDTLTYGGAWFNARWPLPEGFISAARKFLEQPRWELIPGGYWRISALCEVRGRGQEAAASAPGTSSSIGWYDPVTDAFGTVAHANSGTGVCDDYAPSPTTTLYAGLVGWTSEVVVWSIASWVPATSDATPTIDNAADGWVQIQWHVNDGSGPPVYNASIGTLTITATVDGVPIESGQRLIAVTTPPTIDYADIAWGPE